MAVELEFRDGVQAVADHVAWLMRDIDTTTMTKEQAIKASETKMLGDYLDKAQRTLVAKHFREYRR